MNIENQIRNKFNSYISQVFWEKRNQNNFLCVELKTSDFEVVIKISKEISLFLDEIDFLEKKYFLDVYSQGREDKNESKILIKDKKHKKNTERTINVKK